MEMSVRNLMTQTVAMAGMIFGLGCSSTQKQIDEQSLKSHVDLQRYMGRWYVMEAIPTSFEKGANNATETYSWNTKEDRVDIDYRYHKDSPQGKEKTIPQKGFIANKDTNSEWKIEPIWPLKFNYLIVYLSEDYQVTAVGVPDRAHVWIMSKNPDVSSAEIEKAKARLKTLGYDLAKLEKVPQVWH